LGRTEVNNGRTLCLLMVDTGEKAKSLRDMVVPKTLANFLYLAGFLGVICYRFPPVIGPAPPGAPVPGIPAGPS
jgi:hypothetical protein